MYKEILGSNLKAYRKKSKLCQKEVADMLNISRITYLHYETGHALPSLDILIKLSNFFNTSLFSLIEPLFLKDVHFDGKKIVCGTDNPQPFISSYEQLTSNEKSYIFSLMQMYISSHP